MHTTSAVRDVVEALLHEAQERKLRKIYSVYVKVGKLKDISRDDFIQEFERSARGTVAEGAVVTFEATPLKVECTECLHVFDSDEPVGACPQCDSKNLLTVGGDEFYVEKIDAE